LTRNWALDILFPIRQVPAAKAGARAINGVSLWKGTPMFRLTALLILLSGCAHSSSKPAASSTTTSPAAGTATTPPRPAPAEPAPLAASSLDSEAGRQREAKGLVAALNAEIPRWEKIVVPSELTEEVFVRISKVIQPRIDMEQHLMSQSKPLLMPWLKQLEESKPTGAVCAAGAIAQKLMEKVTAYYQVRNRVMAAYWGYFSRFNQRQHSGRKSTEAELKKTDQYIKNMQALDAHNGKRTAELLQRVVKARKRIAPSCPVPK